MKTYCLGFMFETTHMGVKLIEKRKPPWQKGKYNGIGGKVEKGETIRDAMVREFREETGVATTKADWKLFAVMTDHNTWSCCCYVCFNDDYYKKVVTAEDEIVVEKRVRDCTALDPKFIENIPFLIQAASVYPSFNIIHIHYPDGEGDG